jgi:hypothetical protein
MLEKIPNIRTIDHHLEQGVWNILPAFVNFHFLGIEIGVDIFVFLMLAFFLGS